MSLIPYVCILVENVDRVGDFIVNVFGCQDDVIETKPVLHRVILISNGSSITLVQKGSCNAATISTIQYLSVNHVFVAVDDPIEVRSRAANAGGQVPEQGSTVEGDGMTLSFFDGSSEIIFHALKLDRGRNGHPNPHDLLMGKIWTQQEKEAVDNSYHERDTIQTSDFSNVTTTSPAAQITPIVTPRITTKKSKDVPKNPRPIIRGLEVAVLSNNSKSYVPCPPNSRTPVAFETELFKGHVMLILRTNPPDPHYKHLFEGKKRMFELQVQGKFKRLPQGEIVVGGESSNEMELGMIMRTICKSVCNFAGTFISDLSFSFGDSQKKEDYELPHMSAPLFPTMDKIIVTPDGKSPPTMGQCWDEDPDWRKRRTKFKNTDEGKIMTDNTYSFSVGSSNIDLCTWSSVGIPMVKPMNLKTIFGDSDFTFVAYEIPRSVVSKYPNKHPHKMLNYAMNIRVRGLGDPNKATDMYLDDDDDDEDDDHHHEDHSDDGNEDDELHRTPTTMSSGGGMTPILSDDAHKPRRSTDNNWNVNTSPGQSYFSSPSKSANHGRRNVNPGSGDVHTSGALSSDEDLRPPSISLHPSPANQRMGGRSLPRDSASDDEDEDEEQAHQRCGFVDAGDGDHGDQENDRIPRDDNDHLDHDNEANELVEHDDLMNHQRAFGEVDLEDDDEGFEDGDGDAFGNGMNHVGGGGGWGTGAFNRAPQRRNTRFHGERERIENLASAAKRKVSGWFRRSVGNDEPIVAVPETSEYTLPIYDMETKGDLRYCPACIEVNDRRSAREGRRRVLFVLPWANDVTPGTTELLPRLRSYTEISSSVPMVPINKTHKLKKLTIEEKKRLQVVDSYKLCLTQTPSKLRSLLHLATDTDTNFLGGFKAVQKVKKVGAERWEGNVAMATSRRHWTEQCMQITRTEVLLRKNTDAIRVTLRIPFKSIIRIRPMTADCVPFAGYSFFQIETVARVHYFIVRSDRQMDEWMQAFQSAISPGITQHREGMFELAHIAEVDFYLARPPAWRLEKRRIFNCRRIMFTQDGLTSELRQLVSHPIALIAHILHKALTLSVVFAEQNSGSFSTEDIALWVSFLDEVSTLQTLNVSLLSEKEKAVFYLNLYHVLVIHGSLVVGPPPAWTSWPSFFNNISYLFCFDIVSIAEVEHNLLRAAMSRPSTVLTKIPSPTTQFPGLALTQRDFRLNFCINNGSMSMLPYVPVYEVDKLDGQLDEMTSRLLEDAVEIDMNKRIVILPKVCCWYLADFATRRMGTVGNSPGDNDLSSSQAVPVDSLRVLVHYFNREEKEKIVRLLLDSTPPNVKFRHPVFRCRILMPEESFRSSSSGGGGTTNSGSGRSHASSNAPNLSHPPHESEFSRDSRHASF